MKVFAARSADGAWRRAVGAMLKDRTAITVPSRVGPTLELLHCAIQVGDPRQRWIVSRLPAMNVAFALAEVIWILSGADDVGFLTHWNSCYSRFVGTAGRAHGAYGARLRSRFGLDQLDQARRILDRNPTTRQVVLNIWSASDDLPFGTGRPRAGDIPCNLSACLRIAQDRLEWLQVCRSNDLFLGVPYNVVQFTYLQEVLAGWIGIEMGRYTHVVSSLHIYRHNLSAIGIASPVPRIPKPIDNRLPWRESREGWRKLTTLARRLVHRPAGARSSPSIDLPRPLADIYHVLAAEDARKRGLRDEASLEIAKCHDPILRVLWSRWAERLRRQRRRAPTSPRRKV